MNILRRLEEIQSDLEYYTPAEINHVLFLLKKEMRVLKNNKKIGYYNIPCSFDIETTSFYDGEEKRGIMYEWTLGIDFYIIIGRTWKEFIKVINTLIVELHLNTFQRLLIYIHNFTFEFQFLRKLFDWDKIFALEKRKIIQAVSIDGIEFRCSYLLSGYSLKNLSKRLTIYKVKKLVGDLDYSKFRHSKTVLTDKEIGYCINDVLVVMAYIQEEMERLGNITKIPLTKTGYVRQYCRNECFYEDKSHRKGTDKYLKYHKLMENLTLEPREYTMLKEGFMGGFTHANPYYSTGVFHDVHSFDFTSSYPAVMVSEKFPMSKGEKYIPKDFDDFEKCLNSYCCIMRIAIDNLKPIKKFENYISVSHCRRLDNSIENNGRLVSADYLEITITELDYFIISEFYEWDNMDILEMYRYRKDYLPTDFVKSILSLYIDKTELKGVEGREVDYMQSKERINSTFGMCVTDIVRDEIIYDNDLWDKVEPNLKEALVKYNNSNRRFLSYAWGVWVTAYARYNLFTGIIEFGDDYIYSDTDSLKVKNIENHREYINEYNDFVIEKMDIAMEYHKLDIAMTRPKTIEGKVKQLGVWDYEGKYDKFKTLGAKRYMVEKENALKVNGKSYRYSLTVSGISKEQAIPYLVKKYGDKIFDKFNDDLYIPAEYTGKLIHTYIDDETDGYITDYNGITARYHEQSSIHLEEADYSLSISEKYADYLLGIITLEF